MIRELILGGILGMVFGLIVGVMLGEMALILYCVITATNLQDIPSTIRTVFYLFVGVCSVLGIILGAKLMKSS